MLWKDISSVCRHKKAGSMVGKKFFLGLLQKSETSILYMRKNRNSLFRGNYNEFL